MISQATIDRLPIYHRTLQVLDNEGIEIISSEELGKIIGVTPEQIRKDLSTFGEFGKKGVGYYVQELMRNIAEILGINKTWNMAVVGIGHLGWALANYSNFSSHNFLIKALFDIDPDVVGSCVNKVRIHHNDEMIPVIKEHNIQIAIIATPVKAAQNVADLLIKAGVKGIWNFAPVKVVAPPNIPVVNEDLSISLSSISYYLSR